MKTLINVLYIVMYIAPFSVIRYYPFRDRLRVRVRTIFFIYIVIIGIQSAFFCFLTVQPFWNGNLSQAFRIGFAVVYAVISFFLVRDNIFKQLYIWELMFIIAGLTWTIADFIEARFFPLIALSLPHAVGCAVVTILLLLYYPFIFKGIDKIVVPAIQTPQESIWKTIWLAPIFLYIVTLLATWSLDLNEVSTFKYLLTRIFCFGSMIVISLVFFEAFKQSAENARLNENSRIMDIQLTLHAEAYTQFEKNISDTKTARHDFRHHLSIIESYLQLNNKDFLNEYLKEYKSTLPEDKEFTYCENRTANIIVMHYIGLAKAEGILATADLQIPQKIEIADVDICVVLGNCLENAIEACRRMTDGRKFIDIKSELRGNMLIFLIDNSFDGLIKLDEDKFLSSKSDDHGIGISSIKAVAEKYNGTARFEAESDIFRVSIMLQMQKS